jgi:ketosteroid isomerase-like protein
VGGNADVIQQAYGAFAKGDIAGVLDLLTDDVEWSAPSTLPQGGAFRGRAEVGRFFEGVGGAWDPLAIDVEGLGEIGDDLVVGVVRASGTLRGGGPAEYGAVHVFTLTGGRVSRFREYTDLDGPLR